MKVIPIEFKCLVELDEIEKVSKGGIILPPGEREERSYQQELATILAVGSRAFECLSDEEQKKLKPGAKVLINKYSGAKVMRGEGRVKANLRLLNDKDISAILEEDDD